MRTSKQWWEEVKADTEKFNRWLVKQYRGEVTASNRINLFATHFADEGSFQAKLLKSIALDESKHARWILDILKSRGLEPSIEGAGERYWSKTVPRILSFEYGCAVGAHAEGMRLERIRTIAGDESAPADIRSIFQRILEDEVFHERAFREMAGPEAMDRTLAAHRQGREVLGLEP